MWAQYLRVGGSVDSNMNNSKLRFHVIGLLELRVEISIMSLAGSVLDNQFC